MEPRYREPDVRKQCPVCQGPVYVDEHGHLCPDCTAAVADIKAVTRSKRPPRTPGIKVCHLHMEYP